MKPKDLEKAIKKIEKINKLGPEILNAKPYLKDLEIRLGWCNDLMTSTFGHKEDVLLPFDSMINSINNIQIEKFTVTDASGSVGIAATGTSSVTIMLSDYTQDSDPKINLFATELYENIRNHSTEKEQDIIIKADLILFECDLEIKYDIVSNTYVQCCSGLKRSSDLAKDMRTFLEHFKGELNKLRVTKNDRDDKNIPKFSWPKMAKVISKKGEGIYHAFLIQKGIHENLHKSLSGKLKTFTESKMDQLYLEFKNHIYAILNLIDKSRI